MKKALGVLLVFVILFAFPAVAAAANSPETPSPPPEIVEIIEDLQTIYRLIIHYIYWDGTTAAPTYSEQLGAGTKYGVPSPEISGYTPTKYMVSGVMPAREVEYTVIYIPAADDPENPELFWSIEDYEMPRGLGSSYMHVGICIE